MRPKSFNFNESRGHAHICIASVSESFFHGHAKNSIGAKMPENTRFIGACPGHVSTSSGHACPCPIPPKGEGLDTSDTVQVFGGVN